jgi:hypothetical protein
MKGRYRTIVNKKAQNGAIRTQLWTMQKKSRPQVEWPESQQGDVKRSGRGPLRTQMAWIDREIAAIYLRLS